MEQRAIPVWFRFTKWQWPPRLATAVTPLGLMTVLGLSAGVWGMQAAIAPSVVQAYTSRVSVSIEVSSPNERYENFLRRAELVARAAVQRSFDTDLLITEALVTVVGEHRGLVAPVLEIKVTRPQWRSRPDPAYWATYFSTARSLLGYGGRPATATVAPPPVPTTPQPVPAPAVVPAQPPVTNEAPPAPTDVPAPGGVTIPIPPDTFDPVNTP